MQYEAYKRGIILFNKCEKELLKCQKLSVLLRLFSGEDIGVTSVDDGHD